VQASKHDAWRAFGEKINALPSHPQHSYEDGHEPMQKNGSAVVLIGFDDLDVVHGEFNGSELFLC
jgi:hypothetical protein